MVVLGLTSLLLIQVSALSGLRVSLRRGGLLNDVLCCCTGSAMVSTLLLSRGTVA